MGRFIFFFFLKYVEFFNKVVRFNGEFFGWYYWFCGFSFIGVFREVFRDFKFGEREVFEGGRGCLESLLCFFL